MARSRPSPAYSCQRLPSMWSPDRCQLLPSVKKHWIRKRFRVPPWERLWPRHGHRTPDTGHRTPDARNFL